VDYALSGPSPEAPIGRYWGSFAHLPSPRHNRRRPRPFGTPCANIEPGDVVVVADGREALVTARVAIDGGLLVALLEVALAPTKRGSE
jgi:hypothetical protein